jgi:hypothetical protein
MKLAIRALLPQEWRVATVTAPSKVPRECFVFRRAGSRVRRSLLLMGYCTRWLREGPPHCSYVIITAKTEFYATASLVVCC